VDYQCKCLVRKTNLTWGQLQRGTHLRLLSSTAPQYYTYVCTVNVKHTLSCTHPRRITTTGVGVGVPHLGATDNPREYFHTASGRLLRWVIPISTPTIREPCHLFCQLYLFFVWCWIHTVSAPCTAETHTDGGSVIRQAPGSKALPTMEWMTNTSSYLFVWLCIYIIVYLMYSSYSYFIY